MLRVRINFPAVRSPRSFGEQIVGAADKCEKDNVPQVLRYASGDPWTKLEIYMWPHPNEHPDLNPDANRPWIEVIET
jgi:hypothetical protein